MVVLRGLTAHCGGGSGGWASGRLPQESDHSPQEPKEPSKEPDKCSV